MNSKCDESELYGVFAGDGRRKKQSRKEKIKAAVECGEHTGGLERVASVDLLEEKQRLEGVEFANRCLKEACSIHGGGARAKSWNTPGLWRE